MDTKGNVYNLDEVENTMGLKAFKDQIADGDLIEVDVSDMTPEQREKFENKDNPVVEPDDSHLGQMLAIMQKMQKARKLKEERKLKEIRKKAKNRAKNKEAKKARKKNRK